MKKQNINTSAEGGHENSLDERVLNMENNYQSMTVKHIEGTPFQIQKHEDEGWRLLLGINAITAWDKSETAEKTAIKLAKSQNWNFMITVMATIVDKVIDQKNLEMLKYIEEQKKQEGENEGGN